LNKQTVQYITCMYAPEVELCDLVEEEVVSVGEGITALVSLLYRSSHFVVMVVDLLSKHVSVFDGLNVYKNSHSTISWGPCAIFLLKRANLIPFEKPFKFRAVKNKDKPVTRYHCVTSMGTYTLAMDYYVKQEDGHNCGPIAGCKIMDLFCVPGLQVPAEQLERKEYRQIVCECYRKLAYVCEPGLGVAERERDKNDQEKDDQELTKRRKLISRKKRKTKTMMTKRTKSTMTTTMTSMKNTKRRTSTTKRTRRRKRRKSGTRKETKTMITVTTKRNLKRTTTLTKNTKTRTITKRRKGMTTKKNTKTRWKKKTLTATITRTTTRKMRTMTTIIVTMVTVTIRNIRKANKEEYQQGLQQRNPKEYSDVIKDEK
jgi:hypothetical protein